MRDDYPQAPHRLPPVDCDTPLLWCRSWVDEFVVDSPQSREGLFYVARRQVSPWEAEK